MTKTYIEEFNETLEVVVNYLFLTEPKNRSWYENDHNRVVLENLTDDIKATYHLEVVYTEGGYEGAGEDHWIIFKFKDRFVKLPGFYSSYGGAEYYWDDVFEVVPKQVMVTVYERIQVL